MPRSNTQISYGSVTRAFHWLTALIILTAIPLGLIASDLPYDTAEALAFKAQLFSLHKTLGVAAFLTGLARILWALSQTRPAPLHPERKLETLAAEVAHWLLYLSLVAVPISGWVHHAATTGFAPILWPMGQNLPFVPKSEAVATTASNLHWVFSKLLIVTILAHVAGALKHALIDRDATLARMTHGKVGGKPGPSRLGTPLAAALLIYAFGAGVAVALLPGGGATSAQPPAASSRAGNWQVTSGTLTFSVQQMGAEVAGSFANWTADISFAPDAADNRVAVTIDTTSLTLGSVTEQAKAPEFFDTAAHPTAIFTADITGQAPNYTASGTLSLRGIEQPVTLPFNLQIDGNTATMQGSTTLDRRNFDMGPSYPDEASVGFPVTVEVALTAKQSP